MRLRLATYNIHRAIGVDRRFRPDRIVEILQDHDPDIVLLQEVDEGVPRSREINLARELAAELDMKHYALGHNVSLKKGWYGQLEVPAGRYVDVVGRLDGLLRTGVALGTPNDQASGIVRLTWGVNVKPALDYAFRLQMEHWRFTDFDEETVIRLGAIVTY